MSIVYSEVPNQLALPHNLIRAFDRDVQSLDWKDKWRNKWNKQKQVSSLSHNFSFQ